MSILGWILFGLVVGVVGKLLMPGRDPGGFVLTILGLLFIADIFSRCGIYPSICKPVRDWGDAY